MAQGGSRHCSVNLVGAQMEAGNLEAGTGA